MNIKGYLAIFGVGTILCWIAWVMVLINVNPITSALPMIFVFYLTLFGALLGTMATVGTLIRVRRPGERELEEIVSTSLRQAFMLSAIILGCLFLASHGWFFWWSALLLMVVVSVIEYLMVNAKEHRK
ncbi:MAG: hypothetical protein WC730_00510 [Patescibacteria group bacterium]|jgi:hypothetical protein